MEIYVTAGTAKEVVKELGANADQLGYKSWMYNSKKSAEKVLLELDGLELDSLVILQKVMKENDEDEKAKITKLVNALKDTENKKVTSLRDLPTFIKEYINTNGIPSLHSLQAELRGVAYAPLSVTYHPQYDRQEAYVKLRLAYNTKMSYKEMNITFYARDCHTTVPQLLRRENLMVPDETMVEEYKKIIARFEKYATMQAEQFWCKGEAPEVGSSDYWWAARKNLNLTHMGKPTKAVLDLEKSEHRDTARTLQYSEIAGKTVPVPTHPVLPVFSLAHHRSAWVNVVNMKPYKYEEGLRDKLVLPKSHVRLIGALVSNLDALKAENEAEDKSRTIRAKASSSIILAKGPAGTGKTLTAEVYAEEIKRPLYEVQSGQIGTDPEDIENNLGDILNRSIRLRMPLLINEADVFIQARGRDLMQNAVVSVFLRLLEYHNGLVFLTTNRADDIDDAILSRCIAEIRYGIPKPGERLKLWEIMLAEFNVEMPKSDIRKAVLAFPKVVGRDIQNIIRLTNRVCTAVNEPFTFDALRDNAVFKGIEVLDDKQIEEVQAKQDTAKAKV